METPKQEEQQQKKPAMPRAGEEEVYIGSIDQGTTSTRFLIYDRDGNTIASHQVEFTQFYPEAGWVEHDPTEILESVKVCTAKALDKAAADGYNVDGGLKAIGLTNQRETSVIWSKSTGLPLYNAIVWMDVRTSSICRRLEEQLPGGRTHFVDCCGLPINTYFSALKILWLIRNVDAVKDAVQSGDAIFSTINSWVIWNLTGVCGRVDRERQSVHGLHVTDCSNASRTMLMNLEKLKWDKTTLETLGIPIEILPKIISNSEIVGVIANGWLLSGIQIVGCLGDQHAAMLDKLCHEGKAKCTYVTGADILLNTGDAIIKSAHGLLRTIAYKLGPDAPTNYELEGLIAIAGAAVQWLRDGLGIIQTAAEIEEMAELVENSGGVYFVPAFNRLFAPWWRDDVRGVYVRNVIVVDDNELVWQSQGRDNRILITQYFGRRPDSALQDVLRRAHSVFFDGNYKGARVVLREIRKELLPDCCLVGEWLTSITLELGAVVL